ncbi:MAG: hypothetical protein WHX52_11710 [Anaerolineae bacterium]
MDKDKMAQTLYALAEETRPGAAFAGRLERDVLARWNATELARDLRPERRQAMFKRFALAAMAAAVVLVGIWAWPLLPGNRNKQDLPLLPRLASASGGGDMVGDGLLSGAELLLGVELPAAPERAPVYNVTENVPNTPDAALAWAQAFGLPDPQVYRDPRDPESLVVMGSDGRTLTFRFAGSMGGIHYGNDAAVGATGDALSFEQASEIAVAFLRAHNVLPEQYRLTPSEVYGSRPDESFMAFDVTVELAGHPLIGDAAVMHVVVNAAGEVQYAHILPLSFEPLHDYPVVSAQEAWDALLSGKAFRLETNQTSRARSGIRVFLRPGPARAVGESVTVQGWVHILQPEQSGQPVWAQVTTRDGSRFLLSDIPNADALTRIGYNDIEVGGLLMENLGPNAWRLAVQTWEVVPATNQAPLQSLVGTLQREGDTAWLVDDNGARYPLPDPPAELDDGARIEVAAPADFEPGAPLDWQYLSTPPYAEQSAVTQMSGSTVSVVVQPESAGEMPTPEAPFALGQTVELTGVVAATLLREGEREWLDVSLVRIPGVEYDYPLSGTDAVMQALAQLNRLHARIQGQIVSTDDPRALYGQVIEVTSVEKLWPEEQRYVFIGHVAQETIDGQDVAVLTECGRNARYVLELFFAGTPQDFLAHVTEERQVRIEGVLRPGMMSAGLPIVRVDGMSSGGEIDRLPCAAPTPLKPGPEVVERDNHLERTLQAAFTVDRVELTYYYEPTYASTSPSRSTVYRLPSTLIQPVWRFSGVSGDGLTRFTAYVQAVREDYIADEVTE